jgi:ribosomal protein S18 acetylase RimI-like enzyme
MRGDEFADWLPETQVGYAEDMVRDAGLEPERAAAKAAADFEQLFPGGRPSAGQLVYVLEAEGEPVGNLWLCEREDSFQKGMFVYNIWIDEQYRGRGYGKEAMLLAEEEARRRGIDKISLNVFGGNTAARGLYSSLGYEENAISMSKRLQSAPAPQQP